MDFYNRIHNRSVFPQKHVLICEDNLNNQRRILQHFEDVFENEGLVQFSVVPGALAASKIMTDCGVDLIILDHDMPNGNGSDLLIWMTRNNHQIPVITFSGIPQNNVHMMNLGATYHFHKQAVIEGKADGIIRMSLGLNTGIAEVYTNALTSNNLAIPRYWITSNLLVGGNICSQGDWSRIKTKYGLYAVINADGHSDKDYVDINELLELPITDDGTPISANTVSRLTWFASQYKHVPIYVHCHLGASRSPHFVYAILRAVNKMTSQEALDTIKKSLPESNHFGFYQHTTSYVESIEKALGERNE